MTRVPYGFDSQHPKIGQTDVDPGQIVSICEALMNNLNSVLLEGNLCADPVSRTTPKGSEIVNFRIGTNRYYRLSGNDDYTQETSFFLVEVWAKLGTICKEVLRKGRGVRVVGRLKQNSWIDSQGTRRSNVIIVAEHVEFKPVIKTPDAEILDEQTEPEEGALVCESGEYTVKPVVQRGVQLLLLT